MKNNAPIILTLDENFARSSLRELREDIDRMGDRLPKLMAQVQNVVIRGMRTEVGKVIRKDYATPQKDIHAKMALRQATRFKPVASLRMKGDLSVELSRYKPTEGRKGVSVKILKSRSRAAIKTGGQHGILGTIKRGASATFIAKGHVLARTDKSETPRMLFGPSFLSVLNRAEVVEHFQENAQDRFLKDFEKQLRHQISSLGDG